MDSLLQDVRCAVRGLARSPGFTLAVVLTLALGIGANTAIFSLIDSLLFRNLPVKDPEQLVALRLEDATAPQAYTYPLWDRLRQERDLFDGMLAYAFARFNLAPGGETDQVSGLWTSGEFFNTLGVLPILGRTFNAEDDRRDGGSAGAITVISYQFWQQRFGGSADVIGRSLTIERVPFTIVGVTPASFFGPSVGRSFDVAIPLGTEPLIRGRDSVLDRRNFSWLTILGRLRSGVSADATVAALRALQPAITQATLPPGLGVNQWYMKAPFVLRHAGTGPSSARTQYRQPLFIMMGTAILILLIACANIANLLLARAMARHHEMSLRLAIGASRWRFARSWLVESLLLSTAGAACGGVLAR